MMTSYQHMDSHDKDQMASQALYLQMVYSNMWNKVFILKQAQIYHEVNMSMVVEELFIYSGQQEDPVCTLRSLRLDVNQGHWEWKTTLACKVPC